MTIDEHTPFADLLESDVPVPEWWTTRVEQVDACIENEVSRGEVKVLATTPGGRPVYSVSYGEAEPELRGAANFNSALGARDPGAFFRREERKRPVLVVLGGVHGQEMENTAGTLSAVKLMETGVDISGRERPELVALFERLRLVLIPVANPDGRERVPYDGWVGLPTKDMTRIGQGTRSDGSSYGWPGCKAVHPMTGDVGGLGGYYDDAGVNLMHDEWPAPMSPVTAALLGLAREEGPDLVLNLHSHSARPTVLSTAYVPRAVEDEAARLAERAYGHFDAAGLEHGALPAAGLEHPGAEPPPAFNLTSALYHAGVALPVTFECPHGLADGVVPFGYDEILSIQHLLQRAAAEHLLGAG